MNDAPEGATPVPPGSHNAMPSEVSLRDYFAAHAMNAWLSGMSFPSHSDASAAAEYAYAIADAMLAARSK